MQTTSINAQRLTEKLAAKLSLQNPWLMLISRSALFLLFQLLIALAFAFAGNPSAWDESARWWTFTAFFTNVVSIYLLARLFKSEGKNYFEAIRFSRTTWKTDLLWFIGFSIIGLPVAALVKD